MHAPSNMRTASTSLRLQRLVGAVLVYTMCIASSSSSTFSSVSPSLSSSPPFSSPVSSPSSSPSPSPSPSSPSASPSISLFSSSPSPSPSPSPSDASSWTLGSATSKANAMNAVNSDPVLKQLARAGGPSSLSQAQLAAVDEQFSKWAISNGYDFSPNLVATYKENFKANMALVAKYTLDNSNNFWAGATRFAHLSQDLFDKGLQARSGQRSATGLLAERVQSVSPAKDPQGRKLHAAPPPAIDWVQRGMVTPIRDQYADSSRTQATGLSGCGSCFAFAAVSAIESAYLFSKQTNTKILQLNTPDVTSIRLSEEQVLDCCNSIHSASLCPISDGCNGGSIEEAVSYAATNVLTTYVLNPYTSGSHSSSSGTNSACSQQQVPSGQGLKLAAGAVPITAGSHPALMQAVSQYPVLIYFDSTCQDFMLYKGGIYSSTCCSTTFTNHAMLVVGYDLTAGYWLVKNSFGTAWGERGYARIAMTFDRFGTCGMYTKPLQVLPNFDPSFNTLTFSPPMPPAPPAIPPAAPTVVAWPANCFPGNMVGTRGFAWTVSPLDFNASTLTLRVSRNPACDPTRSSTIDACCQSSIAHIQILAQPGTASGCRSTDASVTSPDPDLPPGSLVSAFFSSPQSLLEIQMPGAGFAADSGKSSFTLVVDVNKPSCPNLASFFLQVRFKTYQFAAFGNNDACCGTGMLSTIPVTSVPPTPPAKVDCQVSWSGWSTCTATCGGGQQSRSGSVTRPAANGGQACPALSQTQECNSQACQAKPVDCVVTWQSWSACSVSCGGGSSTRIGSVTTPAANNGAACPSLLQTQACNSQACQPPSADCLVSWSNWSSCNAVCGGGQQTRSGTVVQASANGGAVCPALTQTQSCNTQACPRTDCQVSWSGWSTCTATCGSGQQTRSGTVTQQPTNGGATCPALTQTQSCNTQACPPLDCKVSWSAWSGCNVACGGGLQSRSGTVSQQPQYGGATCPSLSQVQACNQQPCTGYPPPSPPPPPPYSSSLTSRVSIAYQGWMATLDGAALASGLNPNTCLASPNGLVYLCYFGSAGVTAGISGGGLFTRRCSALTPDLCKAQATCPGTGGTPVMVHGQPLCQYWALPCTDDGTPGAQQQLTLQGDGNLCARGCGWCRCGCSYAGGYSFNLSLTDTGVLSSAIFNANYNWGSYWDVASAFNITPRLTPPFTAAVAFKGSMTTVFNSTQVALTPNTCMSSPNGQVFLCYFGSRGVAAGMTGGGLFARPVPGKVPATCPGISGTLVRINGMAMCQYWTIPCTEDGSEVENLILQGDGNLCARGCNWCRCGCSYLQPLSFSLSLTNAGALSAVLFDESGVDHGQNYWDLASAFGINPNLPA